MGVTNLELTNAFATIANEGIYTEPVFFTKILDHNGKVLIDNEPEKRQVIKDSTAFLVTDAMADSVVSQSLYAWLTAQHHQRRSSHSRHVYLRKERHDYGKQRPLVCGLYTLLYGRNLDRL